MEYQVINATEYRNVSLSLLTESKTNPRRTFEEIALNELAASVRSKGIIQPLLVRPLTEQGFEIVVGARRYRAAQIAEQEFVPVRIKHMTDAEVIELQLVENLQRRDVHPMEEAQGFKALLDLEEPTYTVEQIAAKTGKQPAFVAQRLKLVDLIPAAVEAFYNDEIGVGHALLLAKLPADQQEQALPACFREDWSAGGKKAKRMLLPVRSLQFWIETNVLLFLKEAPFETRDAHLVAIAGSCTDCPKRTGHNKLLFNDLGKQDSCSDPSCYHAKVIAHIAKQIEAKPQLVQISTAYGQQAEGSKVLPRNKYAAIQDAKPKTKEEAKRPEFKVCKFAADAIVTDGSGVGTLHKVCANLSCPIHHPKQTASRDDEQRKAEMVKQRQEQAIANTTGLRILSAVSATVPVRLLKRDLLFVLERLIAFMDESRVEALARQHRIRQQRDGGGIVKIMTAFMRQADEGTLSKLIVETTILLAASGRNGGTVLHDAAKVYKIDADAIAKQVRQDLTAKAKTKKEAKPVPKTSKAA